jgi:L-malate glycosyltransferase
MAIDRPLKIGITCYPTIGGSGILASALGEELAQRGHEIHFISYERPVRLGNGTATGGRIYFHPVEINDYGLFRYPDYTLPLSVKMAEVTRDWGLDILHVHYAVPHATAAILARSMLPPKLQPKVVTTLHGTDTTLLGCDAGYGPAIRHALECSDAVTTVSAYLRRETERVMNVNCPIEVIHNFFSPGETSRGREEVRRELGVANEAVIFHSSNLRPVKRIDVLLETAALIQPRQHFKLLVLAGESFEPFIEDVKRLGLEDQVIVRDRVMNVEEYLQASDIGLFTSDSESFCLSILEAMCYGCPSVATRVGGIPEVIEEGVSGLLAEAGDAAELAEGVRKLMADASLRNKMGAEGKRAARELFSAEVVVPQYESLYRRVMGLNHATSG